MRPLIPILISWVAILILGCQRPSEIFEQAKKKAPYDAVIVPGVPYRDTSMSDVMQMRVYWAYYLYEQGITKNVIYSGSAVYTPYVEAIVMSKYGEEMGIPKEHIHLEVRAEHSTENLYFGYQTAKNLGFKKVGLATDPFQTRAIRSFRERYEIPVDEIPIDFNILRKIMEPLPGIDPTEAYVENFVSLEKRQGPLKRFAGTRGLLIEGLK